MNRQTGVPSCFLCTLLYHVFVTIHSLYYSLLFHQDTMFQQEASSWFVVCPVQDFNWKSLFGSKIVEHLLSSLIFKEKFHFLEYCVGLLHHNNGYHYWHDFQSNFMCLHGEHVYYTEGGRIIQCASQLIVTLIKVMHDTYCKHFVCLFVRAWLLGQRW